MIIKGFEKFFGEHFETTAAGSLLKQIGIELSEPMLFGIGQGLGFMLWDMKFIDLPFIYGRTSPDALTENLCRNLNLNLEITETSSPSTAWENVTNQIDNGRAVGLKLDCYHLEYYSNIFHFAGHYTTLYGYDNEFAYLVDTKPLGGYVKTSLKSLELARNQKGPMASSNRTFAISKKGSSFILEKVIKKAIYKNAIEFLNPPIKSTGYNGILKASSDIKIWFKNTKDIKSDFQKTAMLMERAGTGGSLFRNIYRDFLKESAEILNSKEIRDAYLDFCEIAILWKKVSKLFIMVGEMQDIKYVNQASDVLSEIAERERNAIEKLMKATI